MLSDAHISRLEYLWWPLFRLVKSIHYSAVVLNHSFRQMVSIYEL